MKSRVEFDGTPQALTRCWARDPAQVRAGGGDNKSDCGRWVNPDDPLGLCRICRRRITRGRVASWPTAEPEPWTTQALQQLSI